MFVDLLRFASFHYGALVFSHFLGFSTLTFSNLLEPSLSFSNLLEPSRTFSNFLKLSRTESSKTVVDKVAKHSKK